MLSRLSLYRLCRDTCAGPCCLLFVFGVLTGCVTAGDPGSRPFRAGVISLSDELNRVKPLGEAEFAGWVTAEGVLIGSVDGRWVSGVSIETGEVLWWVDSNETIASPITPLGEWVILGFRDGTYMKLNAKTGKKAWVANLDSFSPRRATFSRGILLVQTTSQQLYGLDFQSGSTLWLYDGGFPEGLHLHGSAQPAADEQYAYIGLASGELHVVSLKSGNLVWKHEAIFGKERFHDVMGNIVLADDVVVYSRYDGYVFAVRQSGATGKIVWEKKLSAVTSSVYRDGRYFVGSLNGDIVALEVETGKKIWTAATGQTVTSITPGEKSVYSGGSNGRINALQANNGVVLWHDDIDGKLNSSPVVIGGAIYFATGYKNLYGYKI